MANKYLYRTGHELLRAIPIGSGVVTELGDHLKISGGKVLRVAASTDNLVFFGHCKEAHGSTDPSGEIVVAIRNGQAVYELTLDTPTTIAVGDELASDGTAQGVSKSGTDPIAVAVEAKANASTIRAIYMLPAASAGLTFLGDAS